ncbi:MAG: hypothetical protein M3032_06485 [Verrucomicrobiota bacterium]|nr:hypothetical protein [Verrucomicrobiota bacterium]
MNLPDNTPRARTSSISGEALIGIGITVGALGFMFLLLGWAQMMRESREPGTILLAIGGVMFVVGLITALSGSRKRG